LAARRKIKKKSWILRVLRLSLFFLNLARLAPLYMFKNNVQRKRKDKSIPGMCVFQVYLKGLVGGYVTTHV
tara:strand:+ start:241 stop:453 length:213 start_codon:yes stop_codon:yes gene_type:complete